MPGFWIQRRNQAEHHDGQNPRRCAPARTKRHALDDLLRQSMFGRLGGAEIAFKKDNTGAL